MYAKTAKEVRSERQKQILDMLSLRDRELETQIPAFRRVFPLYAQWDEPGAEVEQEQHRYEEMIQLN